MKRRLLTCFSIKEILSKCQIKIRQFPFISFPLIPHSRSSASCLILSKNFPLYIEDITCSSDGEGEGRGPSGPAEAGGRRSGNVAEERHEPGDGGAGERALEQPGQPRSLALGKRRPCRCCSASSVAAAPVSN